MTEKYAEFFTFRKGDFMKKSNFKGVFRSTFAVLAALLALTMTACSKEGEEGAPDGMKIASPEEVGYILYVPEDWKIDTAEGSILTAAHVEDGDNSNVTVMAYTNDLEYTSIDAYWADYEKTLKGIFDQKDGESTYKLLTERKETVGEGDDAKEETIPGEKAKLDGEDCVVYRYSGYIGGVPLMYMQVISYFDGDFYLFTYTATTENDRYERNEEDVAQMLDEFQFKR